MDPIAGFSADPALERERDAQRARANATRRRIGRVMIGIAALLVLSFAATGGVLVSTRRTERNLYAAFKAADAELGCCTAFSFPACTRGAEGLVEVWRAQQSTSFAEVAAAFFERTIGLDPVAYYVSTPDPHEVDEIVQTCTATRAAAQLPQDHTDPNFVEGLWLRLEDDATHDHTIELALESERFAIAFAALRTVEYTTAMCRNSARMSVAYSGASARDDQDYACVARMTALSPRVIAAAARHERALLPHVSDKGDRRLAAAWALAQLPLDDEHPARTRSVLAALAGVTDETGQEAWLLEEAVGRSLTNVSAAGEAIAASEKDVRARTRLLRASTRAPALRDDACRALAKIAVDPNAGGLFPYFVPPVCRAALPILLEGLRSSDGSVAYAAAHAMGMAGADFPSAHKLEFISKALVTEKAEAQHVADAIATGDAVFVDLFR